MILVYSLIFLFYETLLTPTHFPHLIFILNTFLILTIISFRGIAIWQELERKRIVPGRSWQSLKSWFLKILNNSNRLDTYGTSVAQLIDADKEIYRIDTDGEEEEGNDRTRGGGEADVSRAAVDDSVVGDKSKKKPIPYKVEEDKKVKIIRFNNPNPFGMNNVFFWGNQIRKFIVTSDTNCNFVSFFFIKEYQYVSLS